MILFDPNRKMEINEEFFYKESYYLKMYSFVALIIFCSYSALVGGFKLTFPNEKLWLDVSMCNDITTNKPDLLMLVWSFISLLEFGFSLKYLLKIRY